MKVRIDLKIIVFILIFYITKQLEIYLLIMLFCFLHELGHIFMGIILKLKLEKIEIMPCGFSSSFIGKSDNEKNSCKQIIIAFAGPVVSLILAIVFYYLDIPFSIKQKIVYSNILILIFNLLPIYPLDGGRILKKVLDINIGEIKAYYITEEISTIIIILLTIIGSIAIYYIKNISIFLICIFLWCKKLETF